MLGMPAALGTLGTIVMPIRGRIHLRIQTCSWSRTVAALCVEEKPCKTDRDKVQAGETSSETIIPLKKQLEIFFLS